MSEQPRIFGAANAPADHDIDELHTDLAPAAAYEPDPAREDLTDGPGRSPLDELRAELAHDVARATTARYWIDPDARPGWWAQFDTALKSDMMQRILAIASRGRKNADPDPATVSLLLIAKTCTAIGKGDQVVFATKTGPSGDVRPFATGEVPASLAASPSWAAARARAGSEAEWKTAIRWLFGSLDDDRPLLRLGADLQQVNLTEAGRADEDPTGA